LPFLQWTIVDSRKRKKSQVSPSSSPSSSPSTSPTSSPTKKPALDKGKGKEKVRDESPGNFSLTTQPNFLQFNKKKRIEIKLEF